MASLALGADGEYYNVNADEMAASCAAACHANTLIFLTDVPGVRDASGSVMPWLSTKQAAELEASSIISGGMLPKLHACGLALKQGVGRVRILPATEVEVLPQFYMTKLSCGTEVTLFMSPSIAARPKLQADKCQVQKKETKLNSHVQGRVGGRSRKSAARDSGVRIWFRLAIWAPPESMRY